MNILIPHQWLKEHVATKLSARDLARRVSISGPSIERIEAAGDAQVYDVEITTNRIDSFSITGFAREVAVILGEPLSDVLDPARLKKAWSEVSKNVIKNQKAGKYASYDLKVSIEDEKLCRRYCGAILEGVKVGPSPKWMKERLEMCGIRSVNNVVDVTNYVMLELGQPMHAFDASSVSGVDLVDDVGVLQRSVIVRKAAKGEKVSTLDGQEKKLDADMLVIADDDKVLAIAGIKGGAAAEINEKTKTVILESASFDPIAVRTASRVLNLRTDASARFEKNLHPEYASYALMRAISLLEECSGGHVVAVADEYPEPEKVSAYEFAWDTLSRMSGVEVDKKEAGRILTSLGFGVQKTEDGLLITVPFWREYDIEGEADFVEEIVRIHGYEKLPVEPLGGVIPLYNSDNSFAWERETKHFLRDVGFSEVMTYSFISEDLLRKGGFGPEDAVKIANPLSNEFEFMRPSLVMGLLQIIADHKQKRESMKLFELSKVYYLKKNDLPNEELHLAGVMMEKGSVGDLFSALKGAVEALLQQWFSTGAHRVSYTLIPENEGFFAGGYSAYVEYGGKTLGRIGIVADVYAKTFSFAKQYVGLFDINFDLALPLMTHEKSYTSLPKYPASLRDIAMVVAMKYPYSKIVETMKKVSALVRTVELFDVFTSDKLGVGKHSLAFHIEYRSDKNTLSTEEVDKVHDSLVARLKQDYDIEVR